MQIDDVALDQEMFRAVDRNHRRAVARVVEREPEKKVMPAWACVLWIAVMAAVAAACILYSAA